MGVTPDNYEKEAKSSQYLNTRDLEIGKNRLRILASAKEGQQYWSLEKPIRKPLGAPVDLSQVDVNKFSGKRQVDKIWIIPVWDYRDSQVKVFVIPQAGIRDGIVDIEEVNGDATDYDIFINKEDKGGKISYSVISGRQAPLSSEARDAWDAIKERYNPEALFEENGDPFGGESAEEKKAEGESRKSELDEFKEDIGAE